MTKVEFNKVTWYSQVAAIILGVLIFAAGFYLGMKYANDRSVTIDPMEQAS